VLIQPDAANLHKFPGGMLRLHPVHLHQFVRSATPAATPPFSGSSAWTDSTSSAAPASSAPASSAPAASSTYSARMSPAMTRRQRGRRGVVLIETAMSFFIFIMLLFGLVELGRAWFSYNMLTYAVREGARLAAVKPALRTNDSAVVARISNILRDGGLTPTLTTVTFQFPLDPGDIVRVAAEVKFTPVIALWVAGGRVTFPLRVDVITRYEV
jgi:hypothetical protein